MGKVIRRVLSIIPAVLIQILWIVIIFKWFAPYSAVIHLLLSVISCIFVLYLITKREEGTYKILWLLVILPFPIPGAFLYLLFGNKRTARPLQKKLKHAIRKTNIDNSNVCEELAKENTRISQTIFYIQKKTGFPVLINEYAKYYSLGEYMFKDMLKELKKAKHYIFVEYFIIAQGLMWDSMVEIMAEKAAEGVDVRVMYDDLGSISTYTTHNMNELIKQGIKCISFNPLKIKGTVNYRDHRKMLIIDGRAAFTGGINLADEYINHIEKYGHWKDIGFCITGAPVQNFVTMYEEFWNAFSNNSYKKIERNMDTDLKDLTVATNKINKGDGYVISYYDSPINSEATSNNLYIELLSIATKYAWFYTPYLMLGDALLEAFVRAAERGVDVRIIMPGIPDKKIVFRMSRSYYHVLIKAGVKIYEYTPGFVHAKGCIIDDIVGTIGTVNLDYRSLFLHFENNSLFYKSSLLKNLKKDYLNTIEKCHEVLQDNIKEYPIKWLIDGVLRIFAPLC